MNKEAFKKVLKISEEFFGTESDPEQMPINQESVDKLVSIHPDTILYKFDEMGQPIAWAVVVPTSLDVMNKFIHKKITERELLDQATEGKKFESVYVCAAFVLPEHRGKGHAKDLLIEAIRKVSSGRDLPLYCWIYSEEGRKLSNSISRELGKPILNRE